MSLKKIDFITPTSSQYDVLHHFTQKLYEAWVRAGYECRLFPSPAEAWEEMTKDSPDLVICFNGIPQKGTRYLTEDIQKPFLSLIVDPFYRFIEIARDPFVIMGCDDFYSTSMFKRLNYRTLFVPHAVESDIISDSGVKKIYDVSMLATFIDYERRRENWRIQYPEQICHVMDEAIEMSMGDPELTFMEACISSLNTLYENQPEIGKLDINTFDILKDMELYIKGRERIDLLKAIQTSPVHVFGSSVDDRTWQKYFQNQSNIIIHEAVNYEQGLQVLRESKIVLNCSLKNKYGAHERIFNGLAIGSLVVTSGNAYINKIFTHDVDIALFQYQHLDQLNPIIHGYLSDEEKRQFVVENGRDLVLSHHTWDVRVKQLEQALPALMHDVKIKDK